MREEVASEVFVLDDSDGHAIRQDLAARAFISSDLHLEVTQRNPHVTLEGLCKNLEHL